MRSAGRADIRNRADWGLRVLMALSGGSGLLLVLARRETLDLRADVARRAADDRSPAGGSA
jgi:hypothetical protein